jgi:hypothetical protein
MLGQFLVKNIRRLLDLDWKVNVVHSYKEANPCSDTLTNISCSLSYNNVFFDLCLCHIKHLLVVDVMQITTHKSVFFDLCLCHIKHLLVVDVM